MLSTNQIEATRSEVKAAVGAPSYAINSIEKQPLQHLIARVPRSQSAKSNTGTCNTEVDIIRSDQLTLCNLRSSELSLQNKNAARQVNGNKLFKLLPNLFYSIGKGLSNIVSFGGIWSNNIHALALATHSLGMNSVGIIRGERPAGLTDTLIDAQNAGMKLMFIPRSHYRRLSQRELSAKTLSDLIGPGIKKSLALPSGSSNSLSVLGCEIYGETLARQIVHYDELWMACGTGATFSGVVSGLYAALSELGVKRMPRVVGVNVVSNDGLQNQQRHLRDHCRTQQLAVLDEQGFSDFTELVDGAAGGYARADSDYRRFYRELQHRPLPPMDPVYMGKVLYALCRSVAAGKKNHQRVAILHTGGLQGMRGWQ